MAGEPVAPAVDPGAGSDATVSFGFAVVTAVSASPFGASTTSISSSGVLVPDVDGTGPGAFAASGLSCTGMTGGEGRVNSCDRVSSCFTAVPGEMLTAA